MISRSTDIRSAMRARQRGFFLNPFRFGVAQNATWSPTDLTVSWATSNGNLTATGTTGTGPPNTRSIRATAGSATGRKDYWEINLDQLGSGGSTNNLYIGVCLSSQSISSIGSPFWLIQSDGSGSVFAAGGSGSGGGGALSVGGKLMFAYDHDARKIWVGYNGTWRNSGDPVAGTGQVYTFTSAASFKPLLQIDNNSNGSVYILTINCGATAFTYSIPSGFTALGSP